MTHSIPLVFATPSEITEHALTFLHPLDVASFSQTCRSARNLVYGASDHYLWRVLFLALFDDPRSSLKAPYAHIKYNWKGELQRRIRAELIAFNINADKRPEEQTAALETFVSVVLNTPPVQASLLQGQSDSTRWVTRVLHDSGMLYSTVMTPGIPETNRTQLTSRLRAYFALSINPTKHELNAFWKMLRIASRCYVYDLRNYTRKNNYGPFIYGREINWVHIEAIVNVVQMNLADLHGVWKDTRPPVGLEAIRGYSVPGATNRSPADWACVEGTWRRYVSFMDYR